MDIPIESLRGNVDIAILTIREDECGAVLDRFTPTHYTEGQRRYEVGELTSKSGRTLSFVVARCVKQGEGEAQRLADYLIHDLDPSVFVLVGIGGSIPSKEFTLGDVVCATQVQDFCVRAVMEGGSTTFHAGGGEMHGAVLSLLGSLPQIVRALPEWNTSTKIGCEPPFVQPIEPGDNSLLYGSPQWRKEVSECVSRHFVNGKRIKAPIATARPVASSDALVKDTETIQTWLTDARAIAAIEMELGGVYLAARKPHKEYPILAIRGISDIVGLRRDDGWTAYACHTAASFAYALFCSGAGDGLLNRAAASRQHSQVTAPMPRPLASAADLLELSNQLMKADAIRRGVPVVELSHEAKVLLVETAKTRSGQAICASDLQGLTIEVEGLCLNKVGHRRSDAKWQEAMIDLVGYHLLKQLGDSIYEITDNGYKVADAFERSGIGFTEPL